MIYYSVKELLRSFGFRDVHDLLIVFERLLNLIFQVVEVGSNVRVYIYLISI